MGAGRAPGDSLSRILSQDIETNVHQRQIEEALLLSLSASAKYGPASGTANITKTLDEIAHLSGIDINTLQLVSATGMSSLVVRFGAEYGVTTEYSLYPQTRRVHCLVLVPNVRLPLRQPKVSTYPPSLLYVLSNATFHYVDNYRSFLGISYGSTIPAIPVRPKAEKDEIKLEEIKSDTLVNLSSPGSSGSSLDDYWKDWASQDAAAFANLTPHPATLWAEMAKISLLTPWSSSRVPLPDNGRAGDQNLSHGHTFVAFQRWLPSVSDDGSYHPQLSVRLPVPHLSAEPSCWELRFASRDRPTLVTVVPDSTVVVTSSLYEFNFDDLANTALIRDGSTATLSYDQRCIATSDSESSETTGRAEIDYHLTIASEPKPSPIPHAKATNALKPRTPLKNLSHGSTASQALPTGTSPTTPGQARSSPYAPK
jgi:hypothetical protein